MKTKKAKKKQKCESCGGNVCPCCGRALEEAEAEAEATAQPVAPAIPLRPPFRPTTWPYEVEKPIWQWRPENGPIYRIL